MNVNIRRWLLAGLAAGFIILLSGFALGHFVLGREYAESLLSRMSTKNPAGIAALHIGLRLGYGLIGVFLYVGFRPRFGPGARTALSAGTVLFAATYVPTAITLQQFGILTGWRLWVTLAWCLGEAWAACLVGARLYRERAAVGR